MNEHRAYAGNRNRKRKEGFMRKLILRLTILAVSAVLGITCFVTLAHAHGNSAEEPVEHKYYKSVEIAKGDTLWDIALEYMNEDYDSVNDYVDELMKINHLDSDTIYESRYLTVAYYDTEFR